MRRKKEGQEITRIRKVGTSNITKSKLCHMQHFRFYTRKFTHLVDTTSLVYIVRMTSQSIPQITVARLLN